MKATATFLYELKYELLKLYELKYLNQSAKFTCAGRESSSWHASTKSKNSCKNTACPRLPVGGVRGSVNSNHLSSLFSCLSFALLNLCSSWVRVRLTRTAKNISGFPPLKRSLVSPKKVSLPSTKSLFSSPNSSRPSRIQLATGPVLKFHISSS